MILKKSILIKIILIILIFFVALIYFLWKWTDTEDQSAIKTLLRSDFEDSYVKDIEKNGNIVEYYIMASEGEVEIFDGYKTQVWAYNGTVPGTEIRIHLGDTLKVNFTNKLPDETTIHWHGVRVPNAMDGVPGVTQDPIQPGDTFVYEFTPKDAGTFWFHPHVRGSEQVERGLFGTLIVEDDISKEYSQDVVWVLDDWRLTEDYQVNPYFNTPHDLMMDGRWGNVITVNGRLDNILEVNPGERIRLRIVNTSNARVYAPNFGNLDARIIAVDGMYTKEPLEVNGFELASGNRIDVDIKIPKDKFNTNITITDTFTSYQNTLSTIHIGTQVAETPIFSYPTNPNIPDWSEAKNLLADKKYILDARGGMGMMGGIEWTINGRAYPDYEPIELKYNEFNKIEIRNNSYRIHPIHLHGQFFIVLKRNGIVVDEPYFRDTVLIHPEEVVELGIVALDKGAWASHCHILEHAEAGMMTVVTVK